MSLRLPERRRRREVQNVLYLMKRAYGIPLDYYQVTPGSVNVETGVVEDDTVTLTEIKRGISFEVTVGQKFEYDLGFVAANKNFTYGGLFEVGDRVIIIDESDLPSDFQVQENDYFVVSGDRYNIERHFDADAKAGYIFATRRTQGVIRSKTFNRLITDVVTFEQDISYEYNT